MTDHKSFIFSFGDVEVRESEFALIRAGAAVNVEPTAFRVLVYFLRNPQRLVTKDEIMAAVWPGTAVSDNSLTRSIATLRRLLDDNSREPRYIATVQTLGYRFLCAVHASDGRAAEAELSVPADMDAQPWQRPADGAELVGKQVAPPRIKPRHELSKDAEEHRPNAAANKHAHRVGMIAAGGVILAAALAAGWILRERLFPHPQMKEAQLTRNPNDNPIFSAAISRDGKYLAFSDTIGIHVRLLQTGETLDIAMPAELHDSVVRWRVYWLPDGTRFLAAAQPGGGAPSLWEASVVGGTLRKIRDGVVALSVSPDGSTLAYPDPSHHELWLSGIHGETPRKLFETGEHYAVASVAWSPDGTRLVYLRYDTSGKEVRVQIESRDLKGSPPAVLLSDPRIQSVSWLPDRRIAYVLREPDENGDTCNYWLARIDSRTGKFSAAPTQLTHNVGSCIVGASATADGKRLVFLKQSDQYSVYVANLGPGAASIAPPRHLTTTEAQEFPTAWSADSRSIIFVSNRDRAWGFYRQPFGGGLATPILTGVAHGGLGLVFPHVSPDGKWLVWAAFPQDYERGDKVDVMRVSIDGGTPQLVLTEPNISDVVRCAQSPATGCAFATVPDRTHLVFTSFDPVLGRGHELMRVEDDRVESSTWALSPDGTRIAILTRSTGKIRLITIKTHQDETFNVQGWNSLLSLDWTADGKGLFTSSLNPKGVLIHTDLQGHAEVLWEPKGDRMPWAMPSPDGRYVAMPYYARESNAWMIEDF